MKSRSPGLASPKYQTLMESLKADILSGRYQSGQKLPSEAALVQKSGASRITVGRALRELQNLGLVDRIAGSGTYVRRVESDGQPHLFGLLIPDLGETEIFEPICQGIANAPEAAKHGLFWGHADPTTAKAEQAWRLCQQFIQRRLSGVFFAPLEFEPESEKLNRRILLALGEAGIPVVLLDRRSARSPERSRPDLVGINNFQAGYLATEHLADQGVSTIGFLGYHGAASTIADRMSGYRAALVARNLRPALEFEMDQEEGRAVPPLKRLQDVQAFVCVNDRVAGKLMQVFLSAKVRIPEDIRLVGIDDVAYASLLPVPLTTVRQPTREIGRAALRVMLDRIATPKLPPRELLLDGELVVRESCGSTLHK